MIWLSLVKVIKTFNELYAQQAIKLWWCSQAQFYLWITSRDEEMIKAKSFVKERRENVIRNNEYIAYV